MKNLSIAFFAGAALMAGTAYIAGGGLRAGIFIGVFLTLAPILFWSRGAASLLERFAGAVDYFRASKPQLVHRRPVDNDQLADRYEKLSKRKKLELAVNAWAAVNENTKEPRDVEPVPSDAELFGEEESAA